MTHYFEVGLSGRGPCLSCATQNDLLRLGGHLPPGRYWIAYIEYGESVTDRTHGESWLESEDWGVLEVHAPDDWKLEAISGFIAGPGYLIA